LALFGFGRNLCSRIALKLSEIGVVSMILMPLARCVAKQTQAPVFSPPKPGNPGGGHETK